MQRIGSDSQALAEINDEIASEDPERSRPAREALQFLDEWGDSLNYAAWNSYDGPPTEEDDSNEQYMSEQELREMAMEMLRSRPGATMSDRLTSLADELGLRGDNVDYQQLLGNVRILGAAASNEPEEEEEEFDGHMGNARQLGVDNFPGLGASRWAPEDAREQAERNSDQARRRLRREVMVVHDDDGSDYEEGDQQRRWWVV